MRKSILISLITCLFFIAVYLISSVAAEPVHLKLATTSSTENSGLLNVLLPPFEEKYNIKVDVIAVGTGKAITLGKNGDVDVLLVHDPEAEKEFMENGFGVNHREVMYNDFIILGPSKDPAQIKGWKDVVSAFARIAEQKIFFLSRGDASGTDIKEKNIWKIANITPGGDWYMEVGQTMGTTLQMADEKQAYVLCDRGTFLAYKDKIGLEVLCEGDPLLFNPYSIMAVNPDLYAQVKYEEAMQLIAWVTSVEGQKIIREYKIEGEVLFHPVAIK